MKRGRPISCPYCHATRTVSKGYRTTATLGRRPVRRCKACGRKFTKGEKTIAKRREPSMPK